MNNEIILNLIYYLNKLYISDYKRIPRLDFKEGKCLYFAKILKNIINDGYIQANDEHCVFVYNDVAYDISGIVDINKYPYNYDTDPYTHNWTNDFLAPKDKETIQFFDQVINHLTENGIKYLKKYYYN